MFHKCCVCKVSRKDAISFHHFPSCEKRLNVWLKCLKRDDFSKLSRVQISNMFICNKHFEKRFYVSERRLCVNAYPSLHLGGEVTTEKPSQDNTENVRPQSIIVTHQDRSLKRRLDHSYMEPLREASGLNEQHHKRIKQFDHLYSKSELLREVNVPVSTFPSGSSDEHQNLPGHHSFITQTSKGKENMEPQSTNIVTDHNWSHKGHLDHSYCKVEPLREVDVFDSTFPSGSNDLFGSSSIPPTCRGKEVDVLDSTSLAIQCKDKHHNLPRPLSIPPKRRGKVINKVNKIKGVKSSRKRLVQKLSNLSPRCQIIYKHYQKAKKELNYLQRAKNALKFNKNNSFEKMIENINPHAKVLLNMQVNLCNKKKKGRRFTTQEKIIALSILKQSPKCYKYLHKIFILPSRSTLNKMVANLQTQAGICPQVFQIMKKEVTSWDEKKKICSVIFDEMSLEAGLTYNKNKDTMSGFVELNEKQREFADHALVFMLRGAVYKWQQPIAYYYCQGATTGLQMKQILREIIGAVTECGLKPIALICDQGSGFQSALKSFKEETKREQILAEQEQDGTVTISGVNLSVIFDPSHLIKGLRNNFLNKNIKQNGKISKWQDIMDVYESDCHHTETRLLHKLNDQHIIPEKIKKMKVKNCVKVFSATVSAALSYTAKFSHYADGRVVSPTMANTAETVLFFDKLFDSVNGTALYSKGKLLRTAVTENSVHHTFWKEAITKLEEIKYIDATGREKSVPSIKNFIITLKSYLRLWQKLNGDMGIKIMRPRFFNSDPIEIFFGQVRAYNYRNNDPNCHSFNCTFKSLLITRVIKFHNDTFNCEDDAADQVVNLQALFNKDKVMPRHPRDTNIDVIAEQARRERMVIHSRAYTAGWVVQKITKKLKLNCDNCKKSLISDKNNTHSWISEREYTKVAKARLNYPSEGAVRCFGTVIKATNEFLENNPHIQSLSSKIKDFILARHSFDFIHCTEHKRILVDYFVSLVIRFSIMNWCNIINKILKGTDVHRLKNRILPAMQKKALEKYNKKLRNKSFNK